MSKVSIILYDLLNNSAMLLCHWTRFGYQRKQVLGAMNCRKLPFNKEPNWCINCHDIIYYGQQRRGRISFGFIQPQYSICGGKPPSMVHFPWIFKCEFPGTFSCWHGSMYLQQISLVRTEVGTFKRNIFTRNGSELCYWNSTWNCELCCGTRQAATST